MRFTVEFTESALDDLYFFRKYEQNIILEQIDTQLLFEPASETHRRKPMEPNELADWELRIGDYRVFYDIDVNEAKVKIKAVGWKEHNRLFLRGKEYWL
jgi:mRNA-degrading endonuclease RelE of RelBE toxin-antitoxin system